MSCALLPISQIVDIAKLEDLLKDSISDQQAVVDKGFGDDVGLDDDVTTNWSDGWEDEWNTEPIEVDSQTNASGKSWLPSCQVSLSPTEDLIAIAKDDKGIILTRKWQNNVNREEKPYYEITWTGQFATNENEEVKCIYAVPLASQQRSSQGSPDWTCVIVGFSTGYIRMYVSNGSMLLSQFLHDGPVLNINIKTKSIFNHNDQVDEMIILYDDAIVTIDGFSLYQSLRACRNQLAKAKASTSGETIEPPPLAYRKWRSGNQKQVTDCVGCGVSSPCFFDRLQAASLIDGQNAKVKGSSPVFNCFLATGTEPFLCYYQAREGSNQPILSDVAMVYASKLKDAVFSSVKQFTMGSWFGGSQQQQTVEKEIKPKAEHGTSLPARFGLYDKHRVTNTINISPIGHLAVITDTFNRVFLVNTFTGVVCRVWKGYRDAECGWVVVEEDMEENEEGGDKGASQRRRALFIVIYAPKRGILEIYLTENGTRVGAFNVGKNCKLLCASYQCLGQTRSPMVMKCYETNQCFLLQNDGVLKTIRIPFHCSLSNIHSIRAKDSHQLKRISAWIEKAKLKPDNKEIATSLVSIILDIQAPNMQRKAVDLLLHTPGVHSKFLELSLTQVCKGIQEGIQRSEGEDLEYELEKRELLSYCNAQKHLVELFVAMVNLRQDKEELDSGIDITGTDRYQSVAELLHITITEAADFLNLLKRYQDICLQSPQPMTGCVGGGVLPKDVDIKTFLSCFSLEIPHNRASKEPSTSKHDIQINLIDQLKEDVDLGLGALFFESALKGEASISRLAFILESSRIPPKQIMLLLARFTQAEINSELLFQDNALVLLYSLVSSICALKDGAEKHSVDLPVGELSSWWQSVRNVLSKSFLIGQSLILAIVCRSVAMEIQSAAEKLKMQDQSDIVSGGWETVTVDMEQWNLLVCQLESLIDVDCFIHCNHAKSLLSGVQSPTLQKHMHSVVNENMKKKKKKKEISMKNLDNKKIEETSKKICDRLASLSVQAIIENNHDAIPQIIADCLVRQAVPGPCLGNRKSKKQLSFRGRLATVDHGSREMGDDVTRDDLPQEDEEENDVNNGYDTLTALVELRVKFPYSLEQDRVWTHCVWESIMVWNEDTEDISMLASALIHLQCMHNSKVQQGLAVMMWKAVFNETIKSTLSLVEKVGKAPKDRLCRKTVSLSYKALEEYLEVGKKLLEMLIDLDWVIEEDEYLEIKIEDLWKSQTSQSQQSILQKAFDEPSCNVDLLIHYWCLVTSLYLIMVGGVKNIKPLSMFDTKGKHAFTLPLHSSSVLSSELDDNIIQSRQNFCCNVVQSVVKQHIDLTFQDQIGRYLTSNMLYTLNIVFDLAKFLKVDQDFVRQCTACELYRVGLDLAAQEVSMVIEDKDSFCTRMIDVVGGRLSKALLKGETEVCSEALSKLPTNISSWLGKLKGNSTNVAEVPVTETYLLLQYLSSVQTSHRTKQGRFINELLECLDIFL